MRIILGLFMLVAAYGTYLFAAGVCSAGIDDPRTFMGIRILITDLCGLMVVGALALMFGGAQ